MENQISASHVCKECESTCQLSSRKKTVNTFHVLASSIAFLFSALLLLFVSTIAGGVGILLAILYFWSKNKKCPVCGRYGLIPVSSPKGMNIMKKNGWLPN
ncbi:hypothetical protein [Alteromonas sp. H39]|uniref:hypothetical protein n=1 Tax=Alteromonas sp. H39 TaxID=3389876 RepID=UPI0039E11399